MNIKKVYGGRALRIAVGITMLVILVVDVAAAPASVLIGNEGGSADGSYLNAGNMAISLVFTSVVIEATSNIGIVDNVNLASSPYGMPAYDLTLKAPTLVLNKNLNMSAYGSIFLTATTLNLADRITSGGAAITPSRVIGTATQVNVLNNAASIQQGMDISSKTTPVTVQVGAGQYNENLMIKKALTLRGDVGTGADGAGVNAPEIFGTQAGSNVITVTGNNVRIEGMHLNAQVGDGSVPDSGNGIATNGVKNLTVNHNTIEGFAASGISVMNSTNVTINGNNASNNNIGIYLNSSSNNTITSNTASNNTLWDFYSTSNSINNTVTNLKINPTISFTSKDVAIKTSSSPGPDPAGYKNIGKFINATNNSADSWLFLNVSYNDSDVAGLNESSLRMLRYNGSEWSLVPESNNVNTGQNYVYSNITAFGIFAPMASVTYNISGYKINDTNGNGIWDSGEAGIQGWNITLFNASTGAFIESNLTNASGFYQFRNLPTNAYNVTEERRSDWDNTNATFKVVNPTIDITNLNFTNKRSNKIDSCTTISSPGNYVLNTSINNQGSTCINITSSDVIFDGAGYTIDGTDVGSTYGIYVFNSFSITLTNVTVKNLKVTDWNNGIYYLSSRNGSIINNTASSNTLSGINLQSSSNNTLTSNNANGGGYGILLTSTSNNTLTNNNAISNTIGIGFSFSARDNTLTNNTASSNTIGIRLSSSSNNTLTSNNASNNILWAFYSISNSTNNTVTNLTMNPTISFTGKDMAIKSSSSPAPDPVGYKNISKFIEATNNSADSWLFLNVSYSDSDVAGTNENSLNMWRYNGSWSLVAGINGVNPVQKYVYANITSFGIFAPMGDAPPHLTVINVTPNPTTLVVGDIQTFLASPKDQYDAAFTASVTWSSSNTTVGTVDPNSGEFTAHVVGTTMVNATNSSVTGTSVVTVERVPPFLDSINVTPDPASLVVGDIQIFTASTKDQYGDAISASVIWASSNETVGTINSNTGEFTALDVGTTMVNASNGSVSAGASVTVQAAPVLPSIRFINGTVKDNSTGNSFAGVTVSANSTLSTTSDSTGFYSFAVTNGTYNLVSTINDIRFYTNTTSVSTFGKDVVILDIEMMKKPTGNITGSVTIA